MSAFDQLQQEPDPIVLIELPAYDEPFPWNPDPVALERAAKRGFKPGDLFAQMNTLTRASRENRRVIEEAQAEAEARGDLDPEELDEDEQFEYVSAFNERRGAIQDATHDMLRAMARLMWVGFLRYERDLEFEVVLGMLSDDNIQHVPMKEMLAHLNGIRGDEETAEEEGN